MDRQFNLAIGIAGRAVLSKPWRQSWNDCAPGPLSVMWSLQGESRLLRLQTSQTPQFSPSKSTSNIGGFSTQLYQYRDYLQPTNSGYPRPSTAGSRIGDLICRDAKSCRLGAFSCQNNFANNANRTAVIGYRPNYFC